MKYKILKYAIAGVIIAIFGISGIAQGLLNLQFRKSDQKILSAFQDKPCQPEIKYFKSRSLSGRTIRYLVLHHHDTLPLVFFIHGAPGSLTDYINYLTNDSLNDVFNMISIDRPGYGYSGFGDAVTSIEKQAALIYEIMQQYQFGKSILVGHSYGGPVAMRVAMDYPESVDHLMLLAPAIDPEHEIIFQIAYLGKWPVTRWLTPTAMKSATDEKFTHIEELRKMLPYYDNITAQVLHIHGKADNLVPYANLQFLLKKLPQEQLDTISLPNEGHFLPWTRFDLIHEQLLKIARAK